MTGITIDEWEDEGVVKATQISTPTTGMSISDWDNLKTRDSSQVIPTVEEEEKEGFFAHMTKFDKELEYNFRNTPSDVENLALYLESKYPIGGWTNKWSIPQAEGSAWWKSPNELYGEGFEEADEDTRRAMLKANKKAALAREFPAQAQQDAEDALDIPTTAGRLLGALTTPTTLLPVGQTYKAASGIGGALGFTYGMAEGLADKGEVDLVESGKYALAGAVLSPTLIAVGRGAVKGYNLATAKGKQKKAVKEASDLVTSYQTMVYHYIANGEKPIAAKALTNKVLSVTDDTMLDVVKLAERKIHFPSQAEAKLYNEAVDVATGTKTVKGGFIEDLFGVLSTRVKDISVPVWHRLRRLEFNVHTRIHKNYTAVAPFLKQLEKLGNEDKHVVTLGLFNSDFKLVEGVFKRNGQTELLESFSAVKEVLQELHQASKDAGIKVGYLENYFPRRIKDYGKFLESLGAKETSRFNTIVTAATKSKGAKLTNTELVEMADKYFRGRLKGVDTAAPFAKERKVDVVTSDMLQHYHTPREALHTYINRVVNETEKRAFFGRHTQSSQFGHIDINNSIGAITTAEEKAGRLNPFNADELKTLLDARFIGGEIAPSEWIRKTKNILYMQTLGNVVSTVTQIGDVFLASWKNGIKPVLQTLVTKNKIKLDDYGFIDIAEEFANKGKTAKWLQGAFKWSGFTKVDQFGKETLLNSSLIKYTKEVNDPKKLQAFIKKWKPAFGKDLDNLVDALKTGNTKSEDVRMLLWHDLSDMQPVSLSEVPKQYLNNPNGRAFYMLKTFTLKSMDNMRRDGIKLLRNKGTRLEGAQNLARYAAVFTAAGMSTDAVKSWMLGREYTMEDSAVDSLWKLVGMSRYTSEKMADSPIQEGVKMILPPVNLWDGMLKDAWDYSDASYKLGVTDEEKGEIDGKSIRNIPLGGKLYYEHFMGGKEAFEEKKEVERSNFRRGGLASQAERLGFNKGGDASLDETPLGQQLMTLDYSSDQLPITEVPSIPKRSALTEPTTVKEQFSSYYDKRANARRKTDADVESGDIGSFRGAVNNVGGLAGLGFDVAGHLIDESVTAYLDNLKSVAPTTYADVSEEVKEAKDWALNTDAGKAALDAARAGMKVYGTYKKENPQDAKTLESVLNIFMFGGGAKSIASQMSRLTPTKDADFMPMSDLTVDDVVTPKAVMPEPSKSSIVDTKKKKPKRDKEAEARELTELAEGLTESGGFKYKLPTMLLNESGKFKKAHWKNTLKGWLNRGKIKKEELDDSRIMDWLEAQGKNKKIATKDIFSFMQDNSPLLKTYTSKVQTKADTGWLNKQPLQQEQVKLRDDYHNQLSEVAYLQDINNVTSSDVLSPRHSKLVKETADWVHHAVIKDIINVDYHNNNNSPIDKEFLKHLIDSPYTKKAIKKKGLDAEISNDISSIFHPNFQNALNDYSSRKEYLREATVELLSQSPDQRNAYIGQALIENLNQAYIKAPEGSNRKEILKNYVDIMVKSFKTKENFAAFEKDNSFELSKLYDEAMERSSGDVLADTWSSYSLPNTRGKPVTILVQSKIGKEDRLKKLGDFTDAVNQQMKDGEQGLGRLSYITPMPTLENLVTTMREPNSLFSTKERIKTERELRQRKKDFKKKTGVDWDKREEYYAKLAGDTYAEPHFTGVYGESPLKQGIPQENIILHIRGNIIKQESLGKGKGLFAYEQQSAAHQSAMGNKRIFKKLGEARPEFRNISGYSKLGMGSKVDELIQKKNKIQNAIDKLWEETDVSGQPNVLKVSKIVTPMDQKIVDIERQIQKLTGQHKTSQLLGVFDEAIPENLSHKKNWTSLAMKQMIKYAIDNDLNYIALPIEKHTMRQVEKWGDDDPGAMQAIINRNSIYSPRAYKNIVEKWDKDAVARQDEYLDRDRNGDWTEGDIHKVVVFPITDAIKAGFKKDGLNAYRRGGLVTQMKALIPNA